ncbi:hypothetical protein FQN57_001426 [Myotisia sp. PD_48]|nr:hypothetical protein FQN57_001426 [Myotisia sp. PD_48]
MPAKVHTAIATRSSTLRLPPVQPSIASFSKTGKAGVTLSTTKAALSLKRKIQVVDHEDSNLDPACPIIEPNHSKRSRNLSSSKSYSPAEPLSTSDIDYAGSFQQLPPEFYELIDLHSAFLGALSLHFAHNGPTVPANLRDLLPSIERIWNKRKIIVEDLQKLLHIQKECQSSSRSTFRLNSYGSHILLEQLDNSACNHSPTVKETELKEQFSRGLKSFWAHHVQSRDTEKTSAGAVANIPLAPIHSSKGPNASTTGAQRSLENVFGILQTKPIVSKNIREEKADISRNPTATANRRSGLLERIKSKSLQRSKLPPVSKETMAKRTAIKRMPEILNILLSLSPIHPNNAEQPTHPLLLRRPYTMDRIKQNIRDSLRSPIANQEIEACLNILSQTDVAGDWITIITKNRMKTVVLRSDRRPSSKMVNDRISKLEI